MYIRVHVRAREGESRGDERLKKDTKKATKQGKESKGKDSQGCRRRTGIPSTARALPSTATGGGKIPTRLHCAVEPSTHSCAPLKRLKKYLAR
jgi:hypothetical protein